ncbi:hypothetical protein Tco_0420535 [Tanacetum coccineum]
MIFPESEQPPRKRLCLSTLGSRYEVGESSTARPTREGSPKTQSYDGGEVNTRVIELAELHEHDTQDFRLIYLWGYDDSLGDSMDGGGGGLCFPRSLGSLDMIESGDSLGASDPLRFVKHYRAQQRRARQQDRGLDSSSPGMLLGC